MTNPKDKIGVTKIPMHLVPTVATAGEALALMWGATRYGEANWRKDAVRFTVYTDAMERHLARLKEGQDIDDESGLHHLWHIRACAAILLDAEAVGLLIDDRVKSDAAVTALDALAPHAARIRALVEAQRKEIDDPGAHAAPATSPRAEEKPVYPFSACNKCHHPEACFNRWKERSRLGFPMWICTARAPHHCAPSGATTVMTSPT